MSMPDTRTWLTLHLAFILCTGCTSAVRFSATPSHRGAKADVSSRFEGCSVETDQLIKTCTSYLGTPYQYGGMSRGGLDCSGFVGLVYQELCHATLPRSATDMQGIGRNITLDKAQPGDLVLFRTGFFRTINHVGIYLGNNRFIHASTSHGVIESSMDDTYYHSRFVEARRIAL